MHHNHSPQNCLPRRPKVAKVAFGVLKVITFERGKQDAVEFLPSYDEDGLS